MLLQGYPSRAPIHINQKVPLPLKSGNHTYKVKYGHKPIKPLGHQSNITKYRPEPVFHRPEPVYQQETNVNDTRKRLEPVYQRETNVKGM